MKRALKKIACFKHIIKDSDGISEEITKKTISEKECVFSMTIVRKQGGKATILTENSSVSKVLK